MGVTKSIQVSQTSLCSPLLPPSSPKFLTFGARIDAILAYLHRHQALGLVPPRLLRMERHVYWLDFLLVDLPSDQVRDGQGRYEGEKEEGEDESPNARGGHCR